MWLGYFELVELISIKPHSPVYRLGKMESPYPSPSDLSATIDGTRHTCRTVCGGPQVGYEVICTQSFLIRGILLTEAAW